MRKPAAFRATFSDLKIIKTRQCVQLVFEMPLADFDAAYEVLGGLPNSAEERWFAVAPIKSAEEVIAQPRSRMGATAGAKRDWRDMLPQQQAGIRCDEPTFSAFLREKRNDDWQESEDAADCVRLICGVTSRSELETNQRARMIWKQLDDQYQAWKAVEHA